MIGSPNTNPDPRAETFPILYPQNHPVVSGQVHMFHGNKKLLQRFSPTMERSKYMSQTTSDTIAGLLKQSGISTSIDVHQEEIIFHQTRDQM